MFLFQKCEPIKTPRGNSTEAGRRVTVVDKQGQDKARLTGVKGRTKKPLRKMVGLLFESHLRPIRRRESLSDWLRIACQTIVFVVLWSDVTLCIRIVFVLNIGNWEKTDVCCTKHDQFAPCVCFWQRCSKNALPSRQR